jgi:hypothetical protein
MSAGATPVRRQQACFPLVMPVPGLHPGINPGIPTTTGTGLDRRIKSGDDEAPGTTNAETAR